jgi:hypothetical protein
MPSRKNREIRDKLRAINAAPVLQIGGNVPSVEQQRTRWRRRILVAHGPLGTIAAAHLASLHHNRELSETAHLWMFDSFDIVFGDLNAMFGSMLDVSVKAITHAHASMPSYLPANDYHEARPAPAFDQVVVKRPLGIRLATVQMWKLQLVKLSPRKQMISRAIPSDHVPVEAIVNGTKHGSGVLRLATWNVADPFYFGRFHRNNDVATVGFRRDLEDERLRLVLAALETLLDRNDAITLQEVPRRISEEVANAAKRRHWLVSGTVTPATSDERGDDAPFLFLLADPAAGLRLDSD